ncbi:MAG: hypothetical protein ACTSQE_03480 [Candidatus Heimdallarchaeaceae archaeon]
MNTIMSFEFEQFDWLLILLSVLGLYCIFAISYFIKKSNLPSWAIRKVDHCVFLTYFGVLRIFNNNFYEILIIFIISITLFGIFSFIPQVGLYDKFVKSDSREGEKEEDLITNVSLTALSLILLFFLSLDKPYAFVAGVFSLGIGDGLGEVVGKSYGIIRYKVGNYKTVEGSVAVFIGTLLSLVITFMIYGLPIVECVTVLIALAFMSMFFEGVSTKFFDNIIIPLSVGISIIVLF